MNHLKKKAAVKKYSESAIASIDDLAELIKQENPDYTFGEVVEIVDGINTLRGLPKEGSVSASLNEATTAITLNKWFDLWKGNLELFKPRTIQGTGQTMYREIQFQLEGSKPKKSVSVPQAVADEWNKTHFTVRKQSTEMLLPQGKKLDYWWIWNDDTEVYDFVVKELQTA